MTSKEDNLWNRILSQTELAVSRGALLSLPTELHFVEEAGIRFEVRLLGNLDAKTEQARKKGPDFNPFLPYDPDLFVADLTDTHLCLLNKFNVVDHHILIVTREFEEQSEPLTERDMEALHLALEDVGGVAFYNSAKEAGASQRHKHLQIAPLTSVPIETALEKARPNGDFLELPLFSFPHALDIRPVDSAEALHDRYLAMLNHLGLDPAAPPPYNFLTTRSWTLLVPRQQERWREIAVNALGFAGTLLVRKPERLARVRELGPLEILERVAAG